MIVANKSVRDIPEEEATKFSWKSIFGIALMIGASTFWATLNFFSKLLYKQYDIKAFEVVYFRCTIPIVMSLVIAPLCKINILEVPIESSGDLFKRCLNAVFGMGLGFWSLELMSYSKYISLVFIYPIVTPIVAFFIINEKISIFDGMSCALSFSGVLIIVLKAPVKTATSEISTEPGWAFLVPLIAAVFWSFGDVYQRKIKDRIHYLTSPLYQYFAAAILCAAVAFNVDSEAVHVTKYTPAVWLYLIIIATNGLLGTGFYALASQFEKAGRLSSLNYLGVAYAFLADVFYFKEEINIYQVVGTILIISSSFVITLLKGFKITD